MIYDIKDIKLASLGKQKIEWASREMGVLAKIEERFKNEKPLRGVRIGACLHISSETARLAQVLKSGGAQVALCASNPLSTKDDIAASIVKHSQIPVFAFAGADRKSFYNHIEQVLKTKPHITMDDGADLLTSLHTKYRAQVKDMYGSTEETTTGVIRLRALSSQGRLALPVIAVNDAKTKHLFDNRYGTGQSTIDGIMRATNILLAGRTIVVAGYGMCGKGVAMRARGLGAKIIVTEIDPVLALEAHMDGFSVMPMSDATACADIIITVTGNRDVINGDILSRLKDGCILANAGHFDVEIDVASLKKMSRRHWTARPYVEAYELRGGKVIYLLTEGRLVNLAAAEGHPAAVMDMSFSGQALAAEHLVQNGRHLEKKVYPLPERLDQEIAELKLESIGIKHDHLTICQKQYLSSWQEGT
jgi:adenosylhomocysteinase